LASNKLAVWGERKLFGRLRSRQEAEGFSPGDWGGINVCFAPSFQLKIYENNYDWDIGVLCLTSEALCYVGERVRFALRPDQVVTIRIGPGAPRWGRSRRIYITWEDAEHGRQGIFQIRPGGVTSLYDLNLTVPHLYQRLQEWRRDPSQATSAPEPLRKLQPPDLGEVTGIRLSQVKKSQLFARSITRVFIIAFFVSLLLDLPLAPPELPLGWYVVAGSVLASTFNLIPLLCYRESQ